MTGLSEAIDELKAKQPNSSVAPIVRYSTEITHALASRHGVEAAKVAAALSGRGLAARIARDVLHLTTADLKAVNLSAASSGRGRKPANPALSRAIHDFAHRLRREQPEIRPAQILRRFLETIKADGTNPAYQTLRGISDKEAIGRLRQTLNDAERRWSTLPSLFDPWPALPAK